MERLTFDGNFCDIAQCRELPCRWYGAKTVPIPERRMSMKASIFATSV